MLGEYNLDDVEQITTFNQPGLHDNMLTFVIEDEDMEKAFREVLTRWQAKGQQNGTDLPTKSPDLIQIGRR